MPPPFWTVNFVRGVSESPPAIAGNYSGNLLIMGGGRSVWDDLARYDQHHAGDRMAVNDIGSHYHGEILHWVSLHEEYFAGWVYYRMRHLYGGGSHVHTHGNRQVGDYPETVWDIENIGGLSGLFACFVGFALGYSRIVLAGIPNDNSGNYFHPPWVATTYGDDSSIFNVWQWANAEVFKGRVTALSGRTARWLGEPD